MDIKHNVRKMKMTFHGCFIDNFALYIQFATKYFVISLCEYVNPCEYLLIFFEFVFHPSIRLCLYSNICVNLHQPSIFVGMKNI